MFVAAYRCSTMPAAGVSVSSHEGVSVSLLSRLRRGRRKFSNASSLVIDDHRQIEIANSRNRAGAGLDVCEPFSVVAALRCFFRRPDIKRAADPVLADDIVLADQFLVTSPSRDGRARVFENSARGSNQVDM